MLQFFPIVNATDNGKSEPVTGFVVAAINIDETIRLATRELAIPGLEVSLVDLQARAGSRKITGKQRKKDCFRLLQAPASQTSRIDIGQRPWLLTLEPQPDYMRLQQRKRWSYSFAVLLLVLSSSLAWNSRGIGQMLRPWQLRGHVTRVPVEPA